jgi:hypothetical protein
MTSSTQGRIHGKRGETSSDGLIRLDADKPAYLRAFVDWLQSVSVEGDESQ